LRNNLEAMAAWSARAGVALAPHGKTAMSPELAARQLAHGAWGITVASIGQLATYRAFGFGRLLLANELTDRAGIAWLAADPGFEAYCYVDSLDGVAILASALRQHPAGRPPRVLVEIGHAGGRTGEQALAGAARAAGTGAVQVILRSGAYLTHDHGLPAWRAASTAGWTVTELNDQRAYLRLDPVPRSRRAIWSAWAYRTRAPRSTSGVSWSDLVHVFF
jgi:D-serine deaminase-like pyridoxal phosphate-dependent protein